MTDDERETEAEQALIDWCKRGNALDLPRDNPSRRDYAMRCDGDHDVSVVDWARAEPDASGRMQPKLIARGESWRAIYQSLRNGQPKPLTPKDTNTMTFRLGTRVTWNGRLASVVYVRMKPPDYAVPHVYSIDLDDQHHRPDYVGTIVSALEIVLVTEPSETP